MHSEGIMDKLLASLVAFTSLALTALPARAELVVVGSTTATIGTTTVEVDTAFEDLDYTVGTPLELVVHWAVDQGQAKVEDFDLKPPGFTPGGRSPSAGSGDWDSIVWSDDSAAVGDVTVHLTFDDVHCPSGTATAHFKLRLDLDQDGDGETDSVASFGVNVHVMAPEVVCESPPGPPAGDGEIPANGDAGPPDHAGPGENAGPKEDHGSAPDYAGPPDQAGPKPRDTE